MMKRERYLLKHIKKVYMENKDMPAYPQSVAAMNIQSHSDQFDFHVDPKHYGFQWKGPMYMQIHYAAIKEGDKVIASIETITAEPWLIGSIAIRDNWMAVSKETIEAAQDAAEKHFKRNGHVNETVMSALAPFI